MLGHRDTCSRRAGREGPLGAWQSWQALFLSLSPSLLLSLPRFLSCKAQPAPRGSGLSPFDTILVVTPVFCALGSVSSTVMLGCPSPLCTKAVQAGGPEWAVWEKTSVQVGKCTGLRPTLHPGGLQAPQAARLRDLRAFFSDSIGPLGLIEKEETASA